ncbi:MBOAT family O-acyltransferase [Thioclava nitratireducens]|uniref:MBOAT family O-acyltransferase n=1 Tax=Thioclava nitratireducens TaxID=1915078 RepID=UPI002480B8BB|nr:MBOAT family protein [Thioclava nitratireducens]WGT49797.1 MBOAT family protein [Thioclava nitratireducens]
MVFSSETFLFLFLPLALALYYLTPSRWKSLTLLAVSYVFYAWWRVDFLLLLVGTTAWTWLTGRAIRHAANERMAKIWTGIGVAGCLAVLGFFKYFNFFIDSLTALFGTTPDAIGVHWQILLPIGVSFYVFQSVSYIVDTYRGDAPDDVHPLDFAAFIALFPQLIAGPILRYKDLAHQFRHRTHSVEMFSDGMMRFFVGLAKKVLLADAVAPLADLAFSTPDPSLTLSWGGAIAYMMQLYFDFSGYSDMAIGLGMMLGFRFIENFDTPYISRSITEFWRRWHISLSVWLRDYLYIPLGGNRIGPARTYVNLMTVMVLGGLWHGAAWTFVIWGTWHGGWLMWERYSGWVKSRSTAALLRTLLVVLIGWVIFRATSIVEAGQVFAGMLGANGIGLSPDAAFEITGESVAVLVIAIGVAILEPWLARMVEGPLSPRPDGTLTATSAIVPPMAVTVLATLTILKLAEQSFSPFLYFQF